MAFADIQDAERSWSLRVKRLAWYGLTLHLDKTRRESVRPD
jgi:hypothetical protein